MCKTSEDQMDSNVSTDQHSTFPKIIKLNVGGHFYTTTHLTLTKCPDNMLAAMFSGKYSVVKDEEGRYFIDADGSNFIHILNYLRYGNIPPPKIAEHVYGEAAYFGIYRLVQELERYPSILAKIQRANYRKNFPGYTECLEAIVSSACAPVSARTSEVKLLIFQSENTHEDEDFDHKHSCFCKKVGEKKPTSADASLGPWKVEASEKEVVNCLVLDLESRGFTVTHKFHKTCKYAANDSRCIKVFYNITFHWWKS